MSDTPLSGEERERLVVERYKAGDKISSIVSEAGVAHSTVYYILEKHGLRANRARRRSAILDNATADALYELIQHQHEVIRALEQRRDELAVDNEMLRQALDRYHGEN